MTRDQYDVMIQGCSAGCFAVDGQVEGVGEQTQGDNRATLSRSRRISRKRGRTRTRPPNPTQPTALSLARQQLVALHDVKTALAVNDVMSMILNEFCLNAFRRNDDTASADEHSRPRPTPTERHSDHNPQQPS